jgi:Zn-dependent oligopeptidase
MLMLSWPHFLAATATAAAAELAKLLGNRTRALLTFEDADFNVDAFLATFLGQLSEKAIDNARQDLGALLATCTEEVGLLLCIKPMGWGRRLLAGTRAGGGG